MTSFKIVIAALCANLIHGFAPMSNNVIKPSNTALNLDAAAIQEIESSRAAFVLCFAGAIGSAAVGREAIPVTWRSIQSTRALKGMGGTSLGGEQLDLIGYPEPVYANDVMAVLENNITTISEIMEAYPIENALPGYLRYEALAQANDNIPQVAVRAVFDALAVGINKNSVNPQTAVAKMALFRDDLNEMMQNSRTTRALGVTALVLLLSILGVADFFAVYHLWKGWFPTWQGFDQIPFSIFDERGIVNLAASFLGDVPAADIGDAFPM